MNRPYELVRVRLKLYVSDPGLLVAVVRFVDMGLV